MLLHCICLWAASNEDSFFCYCSLRDIFFVSKRSSKLGLGLNEQLTSVVLAPPESGGRGEEKCCDEELKGLKFYKLWILLFRRWKRGKEIFFLLRIRMKKGEIFAPYLGNGKEKLVDGKGPSCISIYIIWFFHGIIFKLD